MSNPTCPFCGQKIIETFDMIGDGSCWEHPVSDCPLNVYTFQRCQWERRPPKKRLLDPYGEEITGEKLNGINLEEHLLMIRTWLKGIETRADITNQLLKAILDQNG